MERPGTLKSFVNAPVWASIRSAVFGRAASFFRSSD